MSVDDHYKKLTMAFNQILDAIKSDVLDEHAEALRMESMKEQKEISDAALSGVEAMIHAFGGDNNVSVPGMLVAAAMLAGGVIEQTASRTPLSKGQMYAVFVRLLLDGEKGEFEV